MEGRAIARPNASCALVDEGRRAPTRFNGGPGNCPAKLGTCPTTGDGTRSRLQWRAGQLPGQTWRPEALPRPVVREPSLQWRAGQLPGQTAEPARGPSGRLLCFNGGPGNCPAKPNLGGMEDHVTIASMEGRAIARPNHTSAVASIVREPSLQWRAGQLPGQTCRRRPVAHLRPCFNGGPGNCPAKHRLATFA